MATLTTRVTALEKKLDLLIKLLAVSDQLQQAEIQEATKPVKEDYFVELNQLNDEKSKLYDKKQELIQQHQDAMNKGCTDEGLTPKAVEQLMVDTESKYYDVTRRIQQLSLNNKL